MRTVVREFAASDMEGAKAFILKLPPELSRVYVEVFEDGFWRFVYGDDRIFMPRLLSTATRGRAFRIQGLGHLQQSPAAV